MEADLPMPWFELPRQTGTVAVFDPDTGDYDFVPIDHVLPRDLGEPTPTDTLQPAREEE
jgi:hypothetical protein